MQKQAVNAICKWYKAKDSKQEFVLSGYAGTGKSFLVSHVIETLKIELNSVAFATYTGKAALVLTRKADGKYTCRTLHGFLYTPDTKWDGSVEFKKREKLEFSGIKLVVVDEASMPNNDIIADLMELGIRVLFVGDHGQLQPIGAQSWVYERLRNSPDFVLTEIHRQAADNPIIWLSQLIRKGEPIPFGKFGKVAVIDKQTLSQYEKSLINADQVICGLNTTRHRLNQKIRQLKGINSYLPVDGDKVICTQNNWQKYCGDYPLVNGMTGFIKNLREDLDDSFLKFDFTPDFLKESVGVRVNKAQILGEKVDWKLLRDEDNPIDQFNFGDAITGHKSQGSQWNNVLVVNEPFQSCEANQHGYNAEWAYTSITRGENAVIFAINKPRQMYRAA